MIKSFRGLLAHGAEDRIRLSTIKGKVGYKIVKFQVIQKSPGVDTAEMTVKIYKTSQSTIDAVINFTDSDLMAVALWHKEGSASYPLTDPVIFDNEVVNQDIYITHSNTDGTHPANYYFELEVIPLDDAGAEYTTLKDMRQS